MSDTYNKGYSAEKIKFLCVDFVSYDGEGGWPILRQGEYVLCKDCKYAERFSEQWFICRQWYPQGIDSEIDTTVGADDFCSRGVRKDGEL